MSELKLTVLTATLNAGGVIQRLIDSLTAQTDKDFEWLVVDGGSADNTMNLINSATGLKRRCLLGKDFGIYDALNRGVQSISEGYYLVVGADDVLFPHAISSFRATALRNSPDIVSAAILQGGRIVPPRKSLGWLYGLPGVAGNHAVGMLLKVDLHERFGFYSKKFPIAADQLFVKEALAANAIIVREKFVAGEFSNEGTSGTDPVGVLTEVFRVQLLTERYAAVQFALFFIRLMKLYVYSTLDLASSRFFRIDRRR